MTILHAVESLSRQAGGLPVAVAGIAGSVLVETRCTVLAAERPNESDFPLPSGVERLTNRRSAIDGCTLVHQHGLWAPLPVWVGRAARRRGVPLLISPHGMLEPWALNHHAWRKRLAWMAYQKRNLESAAALHATSAGEAGHFRDLGLTRPIAVIPLGLEPIPAAPLDPAAVTAPRERRQLLFLSRMHPKKGLDHLLPAWAAVKAPDWELIIAGMDEGGHRAAMEGLTDRLGIADRVRFVGPLHGAAKDTAFRRADVFVLPSHSENFGFVVGEALQYGLPVITTTGTPWQGLLEEGCGWQVASESEPIAGALRAAVALSDEQRRAMGRRGAAWMDREYGWAALGPRYLAVYRWLSGEGQPPGDLLLL